MVSPNPHSLLTPNLMLTVQQFLEEKTAQAIETASGTTAPAIVKPAVNPKFGDYQANGIMAVAKTHKQNPRQIGGSRCGTAQPG